MKQVKLGIPIAIAPPDQMKQEPILLPHQIVVTVVRHRAAIRDQVLVGLTEVDNQQISNLK